MLVTFQYTPQLLQQAHEIHFKKFRSVRRWILLALGGLAFWCGLLMLLVIRKQEYLFIIITLMGYGLLAVILHFVILKSVGKRSFKKLKEYHSPFVYHFTEDHLEISVNEQSQTMSWEQIKKAVFDSSMILLYPSDAVFFIFPEKNFAANEFIQFRELIKRKVQRIIE